MSHDRDGAGSDVEAGFVRKGDAVIVVGPDKSLLHAKVGEVGAARQDGHTFSVYLMEHALVGGDGHATAFVLHFDGPPDAHGWWEGGQQFFKGGYYCTLAPVAPC